MQSHCKIPFEAEISRMMNRNPSPTKRWLTPSIAPSERMLDLLQTEREKGKLSVASKHDFDKLKAYLDGGPSRFAPRKAERSVQQQLDALSDDQERTFQELIDMWDAKHPDDMLTDELLLLRFLRCNKFQKKATWKVMNRVKQRHLNLRAIDMKDQLLTKTLFPVPSLKTQKGHPVFYMKPSRYVPSQMPVKSVINNLAYVMNTMLEQESAQKHGIAFLANMNEWTMSHFTTEYCLKFMMMLQGNTLPVRVTLFLIVNPPTWFNKIWAIMKTMLSSEFQKKVRMIPESDLGLYLRKNYQDRLPDDLATGTVCTSRIVEDYIVYRLCYENNVLRDVEIVRQLLRQEYRAKKRQRKRERSPETATTSLVAQGSTDSRTRALWKGKEPSFIRRFHRLAVSQTENRREIHVGLESRVCETVASEPVKDASCPTIESGDLSSEEFSATSSFSGESGAQAENILCN